MSSSETRAVSTAPQRQSIDSIRRKRNLIILSITLLLLAVGFTLMYFLVWQHNEETDDAYVNGYLVQITPQISGTVQAVAVEDTQSVKAGQMLVKLDDTDMKLAYERAQNELINTIRQNQQQHASRDQTQAQVTSQQAQLARLQADLRRREQLAGAISAEELSHARAAVAEAKAALLAAQSQQRSAEAVLGRNVPLREQPAVLTAVSHVKNAWLNLRRTHIAAPMAGQVAKRNVQLGQEVAVGTPLMVVVPLEKVWVDANFKEGQLVDMRVGQPALITADIYGSKVKYQGTVVGFSAGTGSAFSLLPAQNATGNWIKVVQRVPVRIELNAKDLAAHPLRVGLSMNVAVDTRDKNGQTMQPAAVLPEGEALPDVDWSPVEQVIDNIFTEYTH
ncbi:HlyD family efflux transporter periplasmic adaptor subunit [Stenoxybacter acetivorans]|uniref:HlyD family secretion protein n=1 Tax=Stenoxybacter acetivorans TaxID=422441 RepID=UPI00068DE0FA|nr:HlyD family efflux transporter periplasmic adaptor subunit [Stenoxybacter acetivorans]